MELRLTEADIEKHTAEMIKPLSIYYEAADVRLVTAKIKLAFACGYNLALARVAIDHEENRNDSNK
jgi:hypothetical protein